MADPLVFDGLWCPRETRCAALENAASERGHAVAQRPETVQARSLSPGLGGEFRVMARIPGLQKLRGGPSRNRTVDLSCERLVATASACEVQLFLPQDGQLRET
jgi:hypothetical protein